MFNLFTILFIYDIYLRCLSKVYDSSVKKMQDSLLGKFVWCAMDELTDSTGRAVFCLVVGVLDSNKYHEPFVAYVDEMKNGIAVYKYLNNVVAFLLYSL